jgi:N-acetylneuraminate synthase
MVPVFKVASADITNRPFIEQICTFHKPILLSTGASYRDEVAEAVGWIDACGVPVALLHCVLNYPTALENASLGMISGLARDFPGRLIGYSDHTVADDMEPLVIAAALGASVLEKHYTHDKTLPGNDHYHAMDARDLEHLMARLRSAFSMIGSREVTSLPGEEPARKNARRSLVALARIPRGSRIEAEKLTWKRPAHGISPKELASVVGKVAARDIEEDEPLKWEMLHE